MNSILNPLEDLKKTLSFSTFTSSKKKRPKTGLAPGSIIYTGKVYSEKIEIEVIDFTADRIQEVSILDMEDLHQYVKSDSVTWINVQGLHDVELISNIGSIMGVHDLTLEDIVDPQQRPKVEEYEDYAFIALKMINFNETKRRIEVQQVSVVMAKNFVICFQERPGDVFDDVRKRLRNSKGRARQRGCDYLGYMLLDIIIDYYYETLDGVYNQIERLEELVIRKPERVEMLQIQALKKDLIQLRKHMKPVRDALLTLLTRDTGIFTSNTLLYLRDSHDHVEQVLENLDTYREMISDVMDIYLSQLSNKMNEVMKVLTLIATIFIPLTFVAGIYGMNFEHMPELGWELSYPYGFYSIIGAITLTMIIYMKTKRWF
ncbi:magnesium/cobalt transporter CorA [Marinoscillum sp. MHG1-6]|uniref:magnesium/cobalt transporter CorA n=1 Tax=Marinoscillum sp. MHG1-6 TaxID=2959627 RepID=UPI0021574D12|nr:magnesium/cobalt transporter CorA [Marinoscillum sp. MHG1-6]